tara:strand:+ start:194 stop:526 length:333 start_codon:yes stop_codon:yes gene_type:complete
MKNFAFEKTPQTSEKWINLSIENKKELIQNELKNDENLKDFEVFNAMNDGQIIFKVNNAIPSSKRGNILLDLEEKLKNNIDKGLTVWFEPIGDKSKLRNLRGITFNKDEG